MTSRTLVSPSLARAYQLIQDSALIKNRDNSPAALREFEQILNQAGDAAPEVHRVVHDLYLGNRYGFHHFVRDTANEALVLLTDARSIVGWFRLKELVYLREVTRDGRVEFRANVFRDKSSTRKPEAGRPARRKEVPALEAFPEA